MDTVVENPRKITHEKSYEKETLLRLKRYEEIKTAVCDVPLSEGMKMMDFTDKAGFRQFKAAFYLACLAHKDQVDKSGVPYVFHPFHLAGQMQDEQMTIAARPLYFLI